MLSANGSRSTPWVAPHDMQSRRFRVVSMIAPFESNDRWIVDFDAAGPTLRPLASKREPR